MINTKDSWSRCAKEFITSSTVAAAANEISLSREFDESTTRPVHVKRLDFNNELSSYRGLVATDIALAHLEEIETTELVAKWIADGICTPPTSEQNTSSPSSPVFGTCVNKTANLEEELFPGFVQNLEKSPILKFRRKSMSRNGSRRRGSERVNKSLPELIKSPIIGKRRNKERKFNSWDKRKLDESGNLSPVEPCPKLGNASSSLTKYRPRIKRKRLQDQLHPNNKSLAHSYFGGNDTSFLSKFPNEERSCNESKKLRTVSAVDEAIKVRFDSIVSSQDLFEEEQICGSPKSVAITKHEASNKGGELQVPVLKHSPLPWGNEGYSPSLAIGCAIKVERNFCKVEKVEEQSFESVIQDTEEFPVPKIRKKLIKRRSDSNSSKQDEKFLILDSEFTLEKREFVTDTERIDCDTSSENEDSKPALDDDKIITGAESDSDKTASDIIEEPTTQDYLEPPKPTAIISCQSGLIFSSSLKSTPAISQKISETVSLNEFISPQVSTVDISVETTPPRTPEFFAPAPEILDSGKKKKSKPKKGSLGARLQKLISGQVSCVRLWRHQMSRESAFERSSAPCTTLLIKETWTQCGRNFYQSKVLDDPYDLLNGCLDESARSKKIQEDKDKEQNVRGNLVVMTNPDFVGSVTLLPGTVFKIYLPWEVFNRNSGEGNLILHTLYFNVVHTKLEPNVIESQVEKYCKEFVKDEVTREYDCPCLQNGKVDEFCLTKFTNEKIDIIAEIIKK